MTLFGQLQTLLIDRYGCEPEEVELSAAFDRLNILPEERGEIAFLLGETSGVEIPTEDLEAFVTLEDMIGYIEDRL